MRWRGCVVVLVVGACGGPSPSTPDGPPPPPAYSVSIDASAVPANHLIPRTLTVTGGPGETLALSLDRASAGTLAGPEVTLDAAGQGTLTYRPCDYWTDGCTGDAAIALALASDPTTALATTSFTLEKSATVGEVAPCQTNVNTFYIHGDDSLYSGVFTAPATDPWDVQVLPDQIRLNVGPATALFSGTFSLLELATPLTPGVYEDTMRSPTLGHPGMEVYGLSHGCNTMTGRFQIHEYNADPMTGAVSSVTVSFEQFCDGATQIAQGCFHYESTPPATAPTPDPAKVSVQVFQPDDQRTPDTAATAIFLASDGSVALETAVNTFGQAEASLPGGGSLIVLQQRGGIDFIAFYRGLVNGNHVEIHSAPDVPSGATDQMFAKYTPPPGTYVSSASSCGGGSSSDSYGFVGAYLTFFESCRASTFDLLSFAYNATNVPTHFVWQTGLGHVANANVTVPATWAPMSTNQVTLQNLPAGLSNIQLASAVRVGANTHQLDDASEDSPAAGTHAYQLSYPVGGGTGAFVEVRQNVQFLALMWESRSVFETASPDSITIDYATLPVSKPSSPQQSHTGLSWTQAGSTGTVREWYWQGILSNGHRVRWNAVEPFDGLDAVTLPSLPATHADLDAKLDSNAQLKGTGVAHVIYSAGGGVLGPPTTAYHGHRAGTETYNPGGL